MLLSPAGSWRRRRRPVMMKKRGESTLRCAKSPESSNIHSLSHLAASVSRVATSGHKLKTFVVRILCLKFITCFAFSSNMCFRYRLASVVNSHCRMHGCLLNSIISATIYPPAAAASFFFILLIISHQTSCADVRVVSAAFDSINPVVSGSGTYVVTLHAL